MFLTVLAKIMEKTNEDRGAVAGEYAVLLALIAVALVITIGLFTEAIIRAFEAAIAVLP